MPEDWAYSGEVIGDTVSEVREWSLLTLEIAYNQSESGNLVNELKSSSEKVEVLEKESGGFEAIDLSDGSNTFSLDAPDSRSKVRPVDTWLVSSYSDEMTDRSGNAYVIELELVPEREKSVDNEYETIKGDTPSPDRDLSEWEFDFDGFRIVTRNVTVNTVEEAEGTENIYELEMFLTPTEVRIYEEVISYLNNSVLREVPDGKDIFQDTHPDGRNRIDVLTPFYQPDPIPSGEYIFRNWETEYRDNAFATTWTLGLIEKRHYPVGNSVDAEKSEVEIDLQPTVLPDAEDRERSEIELPTAQQTTVVDGTFGVEEKNVYVKPFDTVEVYIQPAMGGTLYEDADNVRFAIAPYWKFEVDVTNVDIIYITAAEAGVNRKLKDMGTSDQIISGGDAGDGYVSGGDGGPIDFDEGITSQVGAAACGGGGATEITLRRYGFDFAESAVVGGIGGCGGTVSGGGGGAMDGSGGLATVDDSLPGAGGTQQDGEDGETGIEDNPEEVGGFGGDFSQDPFDDADIVGGSPELDISDTWNNLSVETEFGGVSIEPFAVGDADTAADSRPEGALVIVENITGE
jgi:hypothetical protein